MGKPEREEERVRTQRPVSTTYRHKKGTHENADRYDPVIRTGTKPCHWVRWPIRHVPVGRIVPSFEGCKPSFRAVRLREAVGFLKQPRVCVTAPAAAGTSKGSEAGNRPAQMPSRATGGGQARGARRSCDFTSRGSVKERAARVQP